MKNDNDIAGLGTSVKISEIISNPEDFGRMNDPSCAARVKGICGDTMEFYLNIEHNKVVEIKFFTDGCEITAAIGSLITLMSKNKTIEYILNLSPQKIIDTIKELPDSHKHCAILGVNTIHKAIADYYLQKC